MSSGNAMVVEYFEGSFRSYAATKLAIFLLSTDFLQIAVLLSTFLSIYGPFVSLITYLNTVLSILPQVLSKVSESIQSGLDRKKIQIYLALLEIQVRILIDHQLSSPIHVAEVRSKIKFTKQSLTSLKLDLSLERDSDGNFSYFLTEMLKGLTWTLKSPTFAAILSDIIADNHFAPQRYEEYLLNIAANPKQQKLQKEKQKEKKRLEQKSKKAKTEGSKMKRSRSQVLLGKEKSERKKKGEGMIKIEENMEEKEDRLIVKLDGKRDKQERNKLFVMAGVKRDSGRYLMLSHPMHYINHNFYDVPTFDIE